MNSTRPYMACTTPMSRTRAAFPPNPRTSSAGRPKILTSSAPETLNRSVMVWLMAAFSCIDSRLISASRRPIQRAGSTNSGSSSSATTVICQDRKSMVASTRTSVITLDTTDDSVEVNACCAPMTSLFSRLTREPVWVRVKNATGIRCTCSNTRVRRS